MTSTRKTTQGARRAPTTYQSGCKSSCESEHERNGETLAQYYERIRREHRAEAQAFARDAEQAARQRRLDNALGRAGIPPRFQDKRFDTWRTEHEWQSRALSVCQRYAERFATVRGQGTCLVMVGTPGSGKTHLASAVGQRVIEQGYTAVFATVGQFLRSIRDSYRNGTPEGDAVRRFTEPDLLLLDEVGVAIGREDTRQAQLLDTINARYETLRPTILMGNLTRDEMRAHLGDRVWRRITDDGAPVLALGA